MGSKNLPLTNPQFMRKLSPRSGNHIRIPLLTWRTKEIHDVVFSRETKIFKRGSFKYFHYVTLLKESKSKWEKESKRQRKEKQTEGQKREICSINKVEWKGREQQREREKKEGRRKKERERDSEKVFNKWPNISMQ